MAQYYSRIKIKVKSPSVWKRFKDIDDEGFNLFELSETNSLCAQMDCSYYEEDLFNIVREFASIIDKDGIIIADTTNINVDPYDYCVYYFGVEVKDKYFSVLSDRRGNMFHETNINEMSNWLNYGKFSITKKEKEFLSMFDIENVNNKYVEVNNNIILPDMVILEDNSDKERVENIEELSEVQQINLATIKENNELRVDVKSEKGSIGLLPRNICKDLIPIIDNDKYAYSIQIVELLKLSQRNKYAKSPIVGVKIIVSRK